jgi:hypothetical protein
MLLLLWVFPFSSLASQKGRLRPGEHGALPKCSIFEAQHSCMIRERGIKAFRMEQELWKSPPGATWI